MGFTANYPTATLPPIHISGTLVDAGSAAAIAAEAAAAAAAASAAAMVATTDGAMTPILGNPSSGSIGKLDLRYIKQSIMGIANGVATLDPSGLIPSSQLPPIAINKTYVVNSQAAMLALAANVGDVAIRTDLVPQESFILQSAPASTLGNWQQLTTPGAVTSVVGQAGNVTGAQIAADAGLTTKYGLKFKPILKNSAYPAVEGDLVKADTTGGTFAITIPAAASVPNGAAIAVKWVSGSAAPTIPLSGSDHINTSSGGTSVNLSLTNQGVVLVSDGVSIWTVIADDLPLSQLDGRFVAPTGKTTTGAAAPLAYLHIKDYGGVCDGSTDDTTALQNLITAANTFGLPAMICGRVKTTAAVSLPTSGAIQIMAGQADANNFGSLTLNKASIESTGTAVFTAANNTTAVMLSMADVNLRNLGASSSVVFHGIRFVNSKFFSNSSAKYASVWDATSSLNGVCRVHQNLWENNGVAWCAGSITDTIITDNYINGDPTKNATMITGGVATSIIANNYIDFFKRVFDVPQGNADVRVIGNIFDYCWCTLGSSSGQNIGSFLFSGNTWAHCQSSVALPFYPNADSDMTGTPWRAIDAGTNALTGCTVVGNNVNGVDGFIRAHGGVGALREGGNTYHGGFTSAYIDIQPSFYSTTPADIIIEALENYINVPTFAAAQTIDWSQGGHQILTLTGNITSLTFSNAIKNRIYRLQLVQDGTGGRTLAGVSSAIKFGGTPNLSLTANVRDVFTFFYDGTNYWELSRSMNGGGSVYTPMGNAWQLSANGQVDWINGTNTYPFFRISPVFGSGPHTYGGFLAGRGNVAPDTKLARCDTNQAAWISNAPFLKNVAVQTLASNGAVGFSANACDVFRLNLQANCTAFTISTPANDSISSAAFWTQEIELELVQDATGGRTWVAPTNVKWAGGSAPVLSTGANKRDIIVIRWDNGSSSWYEVSRSMNIG